MKHLSLFALVFAVAAIASVAAGAQTGGALLHANSASEAELATVPHVTPELARAIAGQRPFKSVRELDAVLKSLSRQQKTELYGKLFVPISLNTATDAEILRIMRQKLSRA